MYQRKNIGRLGTLCVALGLIGLSGCHDVHFDDANIHISINSHQVKETVAQTFRAGKVQTLRVRATAGDIVVSPAKEGVDEIRVEATKIVQGDRPEGELKTYLANVRTTAQLEGDALVVTSDYKGTKPNNLSAYVRYVVTVPKRLLLDLHAASGDMKLTGIAGAIRAESASGDIETTQTTGPLDLNTVSGGMTLKGAKADGKIVLRTTSGDIEAEGLRAGEVALNSISGGVSFKGSTGKLNGETTSGDLEIQLDSETPLTGISLQSVSGGVSLTLPRATAATLEAKTLSGDISGDDADNNEMTKEAERSWQKTLGSGGPAIALTTTSGDIAVHLR